MKKIFIFFIGGILFHFTFLCNAFAEFKMRPSLLVSEEYNDNIYLDSTDEEGDFITTFYPELSLLWDVRSVDLSLDLGFRFRFYLDNSEENEEDLNQTQRIRFDSTFDLFKNSLFLRVSDIYERVPIDESDKGGIGNDIVNLTDSNTLILNPYLKLNPWRTVTIKADYIYQNIWYDDPEGNDSETHSGILTLSKELSARIIVSLTGSHTLYRPDDNDDNNDEIDDEEEEYDRNDARVNITYSLSDRLSLSGHYGKAWIDYVNEGKKDLDLWGLSAAYEISPEVIFGGGYSVSTRHTVSEGMIEAKGFDAFLQYSRDFSISLNGHYRTSDYLIQERKDDSMGLSLNGNVPWKDNMGFDYQIAYTNFDNEEINEVDEQYDRYGFRFGFYRDMKIGRFRAGYTLNENNSDIQDRDYTNNIIYAEINFLFEEQKLF